MYVTAVTPLLVDPGTGKKQSVDARFAYLL
jgi:hypothetical protein